MPLGCHKAVALQCRVSAEERDRIGVFVDVVMTKVRVIVQDRADEARSFAGAPGILLDVKRPFRTYRISHKCIMARERNVLFAA